MLRTMGEGHLRFKRSRFSTRLPTDRLYSASHSWLREQTEGLWHVGFTAFALRMLGEVVELDFEVEAGSPVERGQVVGWVEGFKAVTDLFCPMAGQFAGGNPGLAQAIGPVQSDPYGEGWLYAVEGRPGEDLVDAEGYASLLGDTIDRMLGRSG